jgi:hypothetical protein
MATSVDVLSARALNRALLARQGLIERFDVAVVDAVEAIGAMQGQSWPALPVGLWSRVASFVPDDLYGALARGELHWGIGLRGTLHLTSAREHPAYAVVAAGVTAAWHRTQGETTPGMDAVRAALLEFASTRSRTSEEIREFVEAWVSGHPDAIDPGEVASQRAVGWRPIYRWSALTRVPNGGAWGTKAPADHLAVAIAPASERAPSPDEALAEVARRHLRAFGPASVEDIACWTGAPPRPLREQVERLEGELERFTDDHGRTLHDLVDAPRPDPETPVGPRLLGAFDSTLLAYASKRRERIIPDALRDVVYQKSNLQIRPSFLVDGLVAGTWSSELRRREATLTLRPVGKLAKAVAAELEAEAEGLLAALHPDARAHNVTIQEAAR